MEEPLIHPHRLCSPSPPFFYLLQYGWKNPFSPDLVKYVVISMSRNRGLRVYVPSKNNTPYFKLSEMEFSRLLLY